MFNPSVYVKENQLQRRDVGLMLQDIIPRLQWNQEEHILDVGCGPGDITTSVLSKYLPDDATVVGCDLSENMIRYAQATYESKRFNFKQLDIGNQDIWMDWNEQSFNKIFSFCCIHWVKDLKQAAENMNTLLKKGGELITFIPIANSFLYLFKKIYNDPKWKEQMKVMKTFDALYRGFDQKQYLETLKTAGFEILSAEEREWSYSHVSMEEFLGYVVSPFVTRVNEEKAKELNEECAAILLEAEHVKKTENDNVVHKYTTLTVHARKIFQV